jgi:hypothetical protein
MSDQYCWNGKLTETSTRTECLTEQRKKLNRVGMQNIR